MFSLRRRIKRTKIYDKDFLETLSRDLSSAGFSSITIKLPHNLVGMENHEISFDEFIQRERNYPSLIFVAYNSERNETIKVLFVNISKKAFFVDDTFPSGHSEPSEILVVSPDPARVFSLIGFFGYYFDDKGHDSKPAFQFVFYLASMFALMAEFISLVKGVGFLNAIYPEVDYLWFVDLIITIASLIVLFSMYKTNTGLYIKSPPKNNLITLANMALKGQLMDNPLIVLIITIVGGILTAFILRLLGLP